MLLKCLSIEPVISSTILLTSPIWFSTSFISSSVIGLLTCVVWIFLVHKSLCLCINFNFFSSSEGLMLLTRRGTSYAFCQKSAPFLQYGSPSICCSHNRFISICALSTGTLRLSIKNFAPERPVPTTSLAARLNRRLNSTCCFFINGGNLRDG